MRPGAWAVFALATLAALLAAASVRATPVVGGPTFQRPQEISIFSTTPRVGPAGYGTRIPYNGVPDVVGGSGEIYATNAGANPVQLPNPTGVQSTFGTAVLKLQFLKRTTGGNVALPWIIGADNSEIHVYTNMQFITNASNPSQVIGVQPGSNSQYTLRSSLTPSNVPSGAQIRNIIPGYSNSNGSCLFSDFYVLGSSSSEGFITAYTYDGNVAIGAFGSVVERFANTNQIALFGQAADVVNNRFFVAGSNQIVIYQATSPTQNPCSYTFNVYTTLTGLGGLASISAVQRGSNYFIAAGIPGTGTARGSVTVQRVTTSGATATQLETITPPSDPANGISPANGMRFGRAVRFSSSNYLVIGAPLLGSKGQAFFYQLDETTGALAYEFPFNVGPIASGAFFGAEITVNCKTFYFGDQSVNSVNVVDFNIGAFYDDYCTCFASTRPMVFASFLTGNTCLGKASSNYFECTLDTNPSSVCNYVARDVFLFDGTPPNAGEQAPCTAQNVVNRVRWGNNCFQDYGTITA